MSKLRKICLIAVSLAVLGMVFSPSIKPVKAMTASEIQAQIQQLQQQITQLQQQLAEAEGEQVWCHDFDRNLRYGMRGSEVRALQTALDKEGFETGKEPSYFGDHTASAVVAFQEKYKEDVLAPWGLEHGTGFVGSTTGEKLNELYGCEEEPYITVTSPNGGEVWKIGSTYNITWDSSGIDKVYIAYEENPSVGEAVHTGWIVQGISAELGRYSWKIPENIFASEYKIRIQSYSPIGMGTEEEIDDESDNYFSIVEAEETCHTSDLWSWDYCSADCQCSAGEGDCDSGEDCTSGYCAQNVGEEYGQASGMDVCEEEVERSITVTSPNGGEIWEVGNTYEVKWENTTGQRVRIELLKGENIVFVTDPLESEVTTYNWLVSSGWPAGSAPPRSDYRIRITSVGTDGVPDYEYVDTSDDYFSIVEKETCHTTSLWSWEYCSSDCKCYAGEGDCDSDDECTTGYCAENVGANYGQTSGMDVCEEEEEEPSITFTSPAGGESYVTGQQVIVKWKTENFPRAIKVQIQLNKGAVYPNGPFNPVRNTAYMEDTGSYAFTVPADTSPGNDYSFMIGTDYPATEISPLFHSNLFSIVEGISKPDLTVTDISWTPTDPRVGDDITFYSTIKNIGEEDVPNGVNYKVCDYIDGVKTNCHGDSRGLEAGKTRTITWSRTSNWPSEFSVGKHTFKVVVDDWRKIDESNEDNNDKKATFSVGEIGYDKCEWGPGWSEPESSAKECGWPVGEEGYKKDCCCCYLKSHIHDLGRIFEDKQVLIKYTPGFYQGCSTEMTVYSSVGGKNWKEVLNIPVTQETWHPKTTYEKTIDVTGEFRYIKIYIPECYNDYSSAKVVGDIEKSITVTSPNGGEEWYKDVTQTVKWTASGISGSVSIYIDQDIDEDGDYERANYITSAEASVGQTSLTIPSSVPVSGRNQVRILGGTYPHAEDRSDSPFSIIEKSITVTSPNGGEEWVVGNSYDITWDSQGLDEVDIRVRNPDNSPIGVLIADKISADLGTYSWTISSADFSPRDDYELSISGEVDGKVISDESDNRFSIIEKSITVTSPIGPEEWFVGDSYDIKWSSSGIDRVNIGYIKASGGEGDIAHDIDASLGKYSWTIPSFLGGEKCKVRITDVGKEPISDTSDEYFNILEQPVSIKIISPNGGEEWVIGEEVVIQWKNSRMEDATGLRQLVQLTRADVDKTIVLDIGYNIGYAETPSIKWVVDDIEAGEYYIRVYTTAPPEYERIEDYSDDYFSIVRGTTGLEDIEDQLASISEAISHLSESIRGVLEE